MTQEPPLRRYWLLGATGVLALVGQQAFDQLRGWRGLTLYALAAGLFTAAVLRQPRPTGEAERSDLGLRLREWPKQAQQTLVAAVVVTALMFFMVDVENVTGPIWILQMGALALVIVTGRLVDAGAPTQGSLGQGSPTQGSLSQRALPKSPIDLTTATTQVILAVIVLGGIWVRFRSLGTVPRGFWFDEADVALLARRIADEGYRPVFAGNVPAYDAYLIAILSGIFGEGIATVRAVSALFGTAMILAGYLVGRELFGKMAGLILAFLIAFTRWPITLSRIGMNNVTLPLFILLTLGLLLRGHRRRSHLDYALAGCAAGAGMLFYSAIASSLIAIGLFAAYLAWTRKTSTTSQVLIAGLAALVVVTPLAKFILQDSDRYFSRNRNTAIWSDAGLLDSDSVGDAFKTSLSRYLPMTHFEGDRNGRHNIPGEPMLAPLVGGLSLLGFGTVLWRRDRWITVLLLVWLPLAFAPGVLSLPWEAPNSLRAVGVLPVMFVAAIVAVMALARTVVTTPQSKQIVLGVLGVALAITAWVDVNAYFSSNVDRSDVWAVHSTAETYAARLTADAPESTHMQAVAFLRDGRQQRYLSPDHPFEGVFGTETQLPLYVPRGKDGVFLAMRESHDIGSQAERLYPNAQVQRRFDAQVSDLIVVRVPAADIAASLGWTDATGSHTAGLIADETGAYRFRLDSPADRLIIDGIEIAACDIDATIGLAAGLHRIVVEGSDGTPQLSWMAPAPDNTTSPWQPVPPDRLVRSEYVPGGLVARHYSDGAETIEFSELDTTLNLRLHEFVLPRPYQTRWSGGLVVPTTTEYEFLVRTDDALTLRIDGSPVVTNGPDFAEQMQVVSLEEGIHPISVEYRDLDGRSEINVLWRTAGTEEQFSPIPAEQLVPWLVSQRLSTC